MFQGIHPAFTATYRLRELTGIHLVKNGIAFDEIWMKNVTRSLFQTRALIEGAEMYSQDQHIEIPKLLS